MTTPEFPLAPRLRALVAALGEHLAPMGSASVVVARHSFDVAIGFVICPRCVGERALVAMGYETVDWLRAQAEGKEALHADEAAFALYDAASECETALREADLARPEGSQT